MTGYNLDEKGGFGGLFGGIKSPAKIIKNGDSVDVKHYNSFDFIKSNVISVADNVVKVQSKSNTPDLSVFPGDHIIMNFTQGEEVYVIIGDVTRVDVVDPLEITMKSTKIEKMKDLRKSERFSVSIKAEVKILGVLEPQFGIVKNISLGGIKMNCKEDIMMEDMVDLTIKLDKVNKLAFKGKVVRKNHLDNLFEYGVEISEIAETSLKILHHFIYSM